MKRPAPIYVILVMALTVANIVLALIGWRSFTSVDQNIADISKTAPGIDTAETPEARDWPQAVRADHVLSRPLFVSSRRPYTHRHLDQDTKSSETEKEIIPLRYELAGVIIEGRTRKALVHGIPGGNDYWLEEGEEIDGWRLIRIESTTAFFAKNHHRATLMLYPDTSLTQ
jgi:hypothetical protein